MTTKSETVLAPRVKGIDPIKLLKADHEAVHLQSVLSECTSHHVKEEEVQMFPKCAKSPKNLQEVGVKFSKRTAELRAEMPEGLCA